MTPSQIAQSLRNTTDEFGERLDKLKNLPGGLRRRAVEAHVHLPMWANAIDAIAS
jgi:hypothetical protein